MCLYINNITIFKNREHIWLLCIDFLYFLVSYDHNICGLESFFMACVKTLKINECLSLISLFIWSPSKPLKILPDQRYITILVQVQLSLALICVMDPGSLQVFILLFQCSFWDAPRDGKTLHFSCCWHSPFKTLVLILSWDRIGSAFPPWTTTKWGAHGQVTQSTFSPGDLV